MANDLANAPDPALLRKWLIQQGLRTACLSQKDIAIQMKVTPQAVSAVVAGIRRSRRLQRYIAQCLGMPYCVLWGKNARKVRAA